MKCPCEGYITFVMCKSRLFSEHRTLVMNLAHTCPYLSKYMTSKEALGTYNHLDVARHVFGLNKMKELDK